jgi:hypothetical protein
MVKNGKAQLVAISEIEEIISSAVKELKQNLLLIENLNESFLKSAKNINVDGFSGEFRDSFMDEIDKERRLTQNLNAHNLVAVRLFANRYDQFLSETASQSYVYETELIPTGNSGS